MSSKKWDTKVMLELWPNAFDVKNRPLGEERLQNESMKGVEMS
jgi:hypothetical protein